MSRCRLELYKEYPQPGEQELAQVLAAYLRDVVVAQKNFLSGTTQRDVHGKSVAALKAQLTVDLALPPELRHGVFAHSQSFPCWIRLSNGAQHPDKDSKPDVRGFAIKLMGVPGEKLIPEQRWATTQDFTFLSTPVFFTATTKQFLAFITSLNSGLLRTATFGLSNPRALLAGLRALGRFGNLLEVKYWSTTPYRLGEIAVKYILTPRSPARAPIPRRPGRNYLRYAADQTLREREVLYDFHVQVQRNACRQPIERGLVEWSERLAPPRRVATIRIPRQVVATNERNQIAENLSMNPWHSLPAHRPLGDLNRGRLLAYLEVARFRRARNLLPPLEEPTAGPDFFADTSLGGHTDFSEPPPVDG